MKEVWIKKTVLRRYIVKDEHVDSVNLLLDSGRDQQACDFVENDFDVNEDIEYDNENVSLPFWYEVKEI